MFDLTTFILAKNFTEAIVNKRAGESVEIEIQTTTGHIDEENLKKLLESNASLLAVNEKIYRLSRVEGDIRKYINMCTDGTSNLSVMTELGVNINSGDFIIRTLAVEGSPVDELRAEFEAHRDNNIIHISQSDRNRWDEKVSAEATVDSGSNYILNLKA